MKNKARFIFPRLIGATIIVGIAALLATILFKMLLGLVFVAGAVFLAKRLMFRDRPEHFNSHSSQRFASRVMPLDGRHAMYSQPVEVAPAFQKTATIVPIN